MPNLDRFSQPLSYELIPKDYGPVETEYNKPILCACGCGREILLDDETAYEKSEIWEDEYIVSEKDHVTKYYSRENDQLVGSQSLKWN